jgi:malate dehydrogenase (oxaloacetate-decarboxylating)
MDIPVAKLMVYSLCGGIDPCRTLPIFLDVGTNNQTLLDDPLYLGWRNERIKGEEYDYFILQFVSAIQKKFPDAFLHWEDFGRGNALKILDEFKDKLCTFNDDIQGTGAVTLAALVAATHASQLPLPKNKIVVYGAGSAGAGISDQIVDAMVAQGSSRKKALEAFYLIDKQGLLVEDDLTLTKAQKPYARSHKDITQLGLAEKEYIGLIDVIRAVKPTVLIGASAQTGAFSQDVIETMAKHCKRPIIFPLSNPTEKSEAHPKDIMLYTKGKALVATGTYFEPVEYQNRLITIAQCNNALVFPGIGLGILLVQAKRLTKQMIWKASETLAEHAPIKHDGLASLLPSLDDAQAVAKKIAIAVAQCAIDEKLATINQDKALEELVERYFWHPSYLPFKFSRD